MPIGTSKVGALGGLVPGGSVTFNSSGTWAVPPGVKKVSITGKGGTGNPGVAGNPGNPGNPGSGGGGAGSNGSSASYGCGIQTAPGGTGGIAFKPAAIPIMCGCTPLWGPSPQGWADPTHWYRNDSNRNLYAMPFAQGGLNTCPYQGAIRPGQSGAVNGCTGGTGNAGTAGQAGQAGNSGQPSSALGNTFPGGAGGSAPPGGAAGNGGTGGTGGSGTTGGNGAGNGGNALPVRGLFTGPSGPHNNKFVRAATGGGGAGVVNSGQPGNPTYIVNAPWPNCIAAISNPATFSGAGGTDPAVSNNRQSCRGIGYPPTYFPTEAFLTQGGNGGGLVPSPASGTIAIFGRSPLSMRPCLGPSSRQYLSQFNPAPLRPSLVRAGGGGGGSGQPGAPGSQLTTTAGAGGGGRGNAGNAGGNSPTVSGQAATPVTFNCVPVTPGTPTPITVGTPGGQVVISWNPQ